MGHEPITTIESPENNDEIKKLLREQLALLAKESMNVKNLSELALLSREMREIASMLLRRVC